MINGLLKSGYTDADISAIMNLDRTWVYRLRKKAK